MVGSKAHPIFFGYPITWPIPQQKWSTPKHVNDKVWQLKILTITSLDPLGPPRRSRSLYNRVPQEERGEKCLGCGCEGAASHKPWVYFRWFQQEHVGNDPKHPKASVTFLFVHHHGGFLTEPTKIVTFTKDVGVTNIILDIDQGKLGYQQTRIGISITTYMNFTWPKLNGKEFNKDAISATKRTDGYLAEVRYLSLSHSYIYIYTTCLYLHIISTYTYIYICIQTCICMYMIHITHTHIRTYIALHCIRLPCIPFHSTEFNSIKLHCIPLRAIPLYSFPFHCIALQDINQLTYNIYISRYTDTQTDRRTDGPTDRQPGGWTDQIHVPQVVPGTSLGTQWWQLISEMVLTAGRPSCCIPVYFDVT